MTGHILNHLQRLGWIVKEFRINGTVEFQAVKVGEEPQIARCNDGEGEEAAYRAACLLAEDAGWIWKSSRISR